MSLETLCKLAGRRCISPVELAIITESSAKAVMDILLPIVFILGDRIPVLVNGSEARLQIIGQKLSPCFTPHLEFVLK